MPVVSLFGYEYLRPTLRCCHIYSNPRVDFDQPAVYLGIDYCYRPSLDHVDIQYIYVLPFGVYVVVRRRNFCFLRLMLRSIYRNPRLYTI